MALAIALIILVIGSVLFHFLSPWWFTPIASNWGMIDDTITITFWVTGFVFIAVNLFIAWAIIRYRYKKNRRAAYQPENKKLEWWLSGLTAVGVVAMLAPGLFVWAQIIDVPEDASEIEVIGQQWQWSFRFPGKDGILGAVDARHITVNNPFGINPTDPNGQDDRLITGNEAHLPVDSPIKALLRSKDVLHDFAVPQFRIKMDLVPGLVTYTWFTPIRTGTFEILCEELCGVGHHTMRGRFIVESENKFQAWLQAQATFADFTAYPVGDAAAGQPLYTLCSACHGAQGEGNQALQAPKLSGQNDWYLARQLHNFKAGLRGTHQDDTPGKQMAQMARTLADETAINNIVAYIKTLPDTPTPTSVQGNAKHGKKLYVTCGVCHGADGQGRQATNAPRLAGIDDWYLTTQLNNFKTGLRGTHPDDVFGKQMTMMAPFLVDEAALNDLAAYINTL